MTTALIGKQEQVAVRVRVALVSRGAARSVAATIARLGHEVLEFDDWSGFQAAAVEATMDLVLCDQDQASNQPRGLGVPCLYVGDRSATSSPSNVGCLPPAVFESILEPLLGMAMELRRQAARCRDLEHVVDGVRTGSVLVGRSPVMRRLQGALSRAADTDATILLEGPRGSGKSLAARVIHCKSRRSARPLQVLECAELDGDTLTKVLEAARGTTLVIEDIDHMPAASQAILVRHLKERSSTRLDAARLIATTSAHLPEFVARGAFREDLYYRLHTFPITMPSLRERTEDIVLIAESILDSAVPENGKPHAGFSPAALALLESVSWPGNVAQLEATVRRGQALAAGGQVDREHLVVPAVTVASAAVTSTGGADRAPRTESELGEESIRPFEEEEQLLLSRALRATKGNVRRAAQLLGIGRATLYRKIQQYKLRLQ